MRAHLARLTVGLLSLAAPAALHAGPCDPPGATLVGTVPFDINPATCAFAAYDYRTTPGMFGEHSTLIKAPGSLFQEANSGLQSLSSDFVWTPGRGWVAPGSEMTYHWGNVRVEENVKEFFQSITLERDFRKLLREYVEDVFITSDANSAVGAPNWNIIDEREGGRDVNLDGDADDIVLAFWARITPQPDDVNVRVVFGGTVVEKGWVLDQCTVTPEPGVLALLGLGVAVLGVAGARARPGAPHASRG